MVHKLHLQGWFYDPGSTVIAFYMTNREDYA